MARSGSVIAGLKRIFPGARCSGGVRGAELVRVVGGVAGWRCLVMVNVPKAILRLVAHDVTCAVCRRARRLTSGFAAVLAPQAATIRRGVQAAGIGGKPRPVRVGGAYSGVERAFERVKLSFLRRNFAHTRRKLAPTGRNLAPTRKNLVRTRRNAAHTRRNLTDTRRNLAATGRKLNATRRNVAATGENFGSTRMNFVATRSNATPTWGQRSSPK